MVFKGLLLLKEFHIQVLGALQMQCIFLYLMV